MSNYCIGDVHGRYDLLIMMLDKIKFDFNTDHVYLLGDVIDGGKGSVRILEYVMEHQESITLLRGNHEENFLFNKKNYDEMILNREMNASLKKVSKEYSKLFQEIEAFFLKRMTSKDKSYIAASPKIKKWLRSGDVKKRAQIFDAMFEFMQEIDFDYNKYSKVSIIFALLSKARTKNFVTELLDLSPERYIAIITFLESTQKSLIILTTKEERLSLLKEKGENGFTYIQAKAIVRDYKKVVASLGNENQKKEYGLKCTRAVADIVELEKKFPQIKDCYTDLKHEYYEVKS